MRRTFPQLPVILQTKLRVFGARYPLARSAILPPQRLVVLPPVPLARVVLNTQPRERARLGKPTAHPPQRHKNSPRQPAATQEPKQTNKQNCRTKSPTETIFPKRYKLKNFKFAFSRGRDGVRRRRLHKSISLHNPLKSHKLKNPHHLLPAKKLYGHSDHLNLADDASPHVVRSRYMRF